MLVSKGVHAYEAVGTTLRMTSFPVVPMVATTGPVVIRTLVYCASCTNAADVPKDCLDNGECNCCELWPHCAAMVTLIVVPSGVVAVRVTGGSVTFTLEPGDVDHGSSLVEVTGV